MRALFALATLGLWAAPAAANAEKSPPPAKIRLALPPGVERATITLSFDDSVIHPAPPVKPITVVIVPSVEIDPAIFLIEPPVAHPVVAVLPVPAAADAALLEGGALALLGLGALVLARRRQPHALGTLAL